MVYAAAYKTVYLLLLLANLYLTFVEAASHPGGSLPAAVNVAVLIANVAAGMLWVKRARHAIFIERALSVGRMTVPIIASTVLLGGLVAYSPVFLVLWVHVFEAARTWLPVLWIACASLLGLEIVYFSEVGKYPFSNSKAVQ